MLTAEHETAAALPRGRFGWSNPAGALATLGAAIKNTASWAAFFMVELRGIEPLSENNLTGLSSGAVCYFHSLTEAGTNTLIGLVESLCMGESTLSRRTVTTQITP